MWFENNSKLKIQNSKRIGILCTLNFAFLIGVPVLVASEPAITPSPPPSPPPATAATLTLLHPMEGVTLPAVNETFVFGAVTPGSTLTINGTMIPVHPQGGYLAMLPVTPGPMLLHCQATAPNGQTIQLDRHFIVEGPPAIFPEKPLTLENASIEPTEDVILAPGDTLRVWAHGSPGANAEFSIEGVYRHAPLLEKLSVASGTSPARGLGLYEGFYTIQPNDEALNANVTVLLRRRGASLKRKASGTLTIDPGTVPKTGMVTEDVAAVRTGPGGGYDLFLYKGMRVRLTAKIGHEWRVRLSSQQSGWIKDSAIQELPAGLPAPHSVLSNIAISHQEESTLIRVPLSEVLPYRTEQSLDPTQLVVTLYGALDRTDLIRYDPMDTLIGQVRWKQIAPDACQVIIQPKFKKWWGYDVRYEGSTLVVEVRKPWTTTDVRGMVIAVDPGHGGSDLGAVGPHGKLEKDANLAIARMLRNVLQEAGAKPFLTRNDDSDVPIYERPRIAWRNQARLFVSVHCNSAGEWENPLLNNGYSTYWYHPQSLALAKSIHEHYGKKTHLPDHGLYFADFAVCRMTQMPAVLTEQAFLIVPEQEILLFDPVFQRSVANAILGGIRDFLKLPPGS
jgi:N-acetylmuramoyl-L-alanine amidase